MSFEVAHYVQVSSSFDDTHSKFSIMSGQVAKIHSLSFSLVIVLGCNLTILEIKYPSSCSNELTDTSASILIIET